LRYRVIFAPEARKDYLCLPAYLRSEVRDAISRHLLFEPQQVSRSRIKRLRGTDRPQYRLRVGSVRVFYDVTGDSVEVLGIVEKSRAGEWLERAGV
jgi:mRNA-degrading endonuclease RelE of RelBE toxin-antitoxin system